MPTTSGARCSTQATAAGRTRTISRTMVNASLACCIPPREAARPREGAKSRDRQKGDNDGRALPVDRPARALTSRAAARIPFGQTGH
jgi:hypothetical protein